MHREAMSEWRLHGSDEHMPGRDLGDHPTRFFVDQTPANQKKTNGGWRPWGWEWATSHEHRDLDSLQVKGRKKMDPHSSSKGQSSGCQGVGGEGPEE